MPIGGKRPMRYLTGVLRTDETCAKNCAQLRADRVTLRCHIALDKSFLTCHIIIPTWIKGIFTSSLGITGAVVRNPKSFALVSALMLFTSLGSAQIGTS